AKDLDSHVGRLGNEKIRAVIGDPSLHGRSVVSSNEIRRQEIAVRIVYIVDTTSRFVRPIGNQPWSARGRIQEILEPSAVPRAVGEMDRLEQCSGRSVQVGLIGSAVIGDPEVSAVVGYIREAT